MIQTRPTLNTPQSSGLHWALRAANAVIEMALLFLVCRIVSNWLLSVVIPDEVPQGYKQYAASPDQFIEPSTYLLAGVSALGALTYYGVLLPAAYYLGWLRARVPIQAYGISLGGMKLHQSIAAGVLLFCVASLPTNIAWMLNNYFAFGEGAAHWDVLRAMPRDPGYWLFMAASSFLLPAILEELQYRGYALRRLWGVYGAGASMIMIAVGFTVVHTQYLTGDIFGFMMSATILWGSLAWCYVTYRTRSVVPAIVAHMITNQPLILEEWYPNELVVILMLLGIVIYRKQVGRCFADFGDLFKGDRFSFSRLFIGLLFIVIAFALLPLFVQLELRVGILALAFVATALASWRRGPTTESATNTASKNSGVENS